jgi:hypothetical protein
MTEKKTFAGVRVHTEDALHARGRWTGVLMHRWPTALGIAVAALAAFDVDDGLEFAALTVLMALVYLGAAALDRRWIAWVVLLTGLPLTSFISSISGIDPSVVLLVAAPVFLVLGVARGQWQRPGGLPLQTAGCSPSVRPCWSSILHHLTAILTATGRRFLACYSGLLTTGGE